MPWGPRSTSHKLIEILEELDYLLELMTYHFLVDFPGPLNVGVIKSKWFVSLMRIVDLFSIQILQVISWLK